MLFAECLSPEDAFVAFTASTPVSAFRPDGTSMLNRGASVARMCCSHSAILPSGARAEPMPRRASIAKSCCAGGSSTMTTPASRARRSDALASAGKRASSPQKVTTGAKPRRCNSRAASKPSPPLFPGPQAIQTMRACGAIAIARRAVAMPARCMSV